MTRLRWLTYLLAVLTAFACAATPGVRADDHVWTAVGPEGGSISVVALDPLAPHTIYAATDQGSGVWKSTDAGATWRTANHGLTDTDVLALAVEPAAGVVYAGTEGGGVFRTVDGGASWQPIGPPGATVHALAIDPLNPAIVYAAADNTGVLKSVNRGAAWSITGLSGVDGKSLAIDPATPTTIFAGVGDPIVYKSIDGGGSWRQVLNVPGPSETGALAVDPVTPTTIYAGFRSRGDEIAGDLYKSTDGGEKWSPAHDGLAGRVDIHTIVIDPQAPDVLYAGAWSC